VREECGSFDEEAAKSECIFWVELQRSFLILAIGLFIGLHTRLAVGCATTHDGDSFGTLSYFARIHKTGRDSTHGCISEEYMEVR